MLNSLDLKIPTLGSCRVKSPVRKLLGTDSCPISFVSDNDRVAFDPRSQSIESALQKGKGIPMLELAGPRCEIYFKPEEVRAAIVTCGGLCPGLNDVIRGIVMELYHRYGVRDILGIRYGYQGFIQRFGHEPIHLAPEYVSHIHYVGGTVLGSSRERQASSEIAEFLKKRGINAFFVIGGDGTMRAALEIADEVEKARLKISIIGIPKTIDNDILYIDESFGFETAFSEAEKSIISAHTEALGAPNGIGLVKLMGRTSGFIACYAVLATNEVNFALIPEVPFELEGETGFLKILEKRLEARKHALIVVAEGAGQELISGEEQRADASGHVRLKDIGLYLKQRINEHFASKGTAINLKYIDPSYTIRSVPANAPDSVYCYDLARNAVHAAMAGKTKMVVGKRNNFYVHLPMTLVASGRKHVDPNGDLWLAVLEATGQPTSFQKLPQETSREYR